MRDKSFEMIGFSGTMSVSELVARNGQPADKILESLKDMEEKAFLKVSGPKTLADLESVVTAFKAATQIPRSEDSTFRNELARHISSDAGFGNTRLKLSHKGFRAYIR